METKISETPVQCEQVDAVKHDMQNENVDLATEAVEPAEEQDVVSTAEEEIALTEKKEEQSSSDEPISAESLAALSKSEMVEMLEGLLSSISISSLKRGVELVKVAFYKLHRAELEKQRADFIEAGGVAEEFVPVAEPLEARLKELITAYREKRDSLVQEAEAEKSENLKLKLQIIEELKALIDDSESLSHSFTIFRELQQRWKDVGAVPKTNVKDVWETYHLHVENFYSCVKINKELRDLDLKKNYESKLAICEEAEDLLLEESVVSAFAKLQKLHDKWREVGPVAIEYKTPLWERFKVISTTINKKHQDYFDKVKEEQLANLALKSELCDKCDALIEREKLTKKEWDEASKELVEIQKVWKTIGFAPKRENNTIYARFREACDKFFDNKREFFLSAKSEMEENIQNKISLCIEAEALAQSEEWKQASTDIIALQQRWKAVGAVPRKESNALWARFRAACDTFFERKSAFYADKQGVYDTNLELKKALIEEVKAYEAPSVDEGFTALKEIQRRWMEIGFVPAKDKDSIQKEFKAVIDAKFDKLRGSDRERKISSFKQRVNTIKDSGNNRKVSSEKEKLQSKIKNIESDITIWENNIGFFSMSKNADKLMADVEKKIEKARAEIALIKEQISILNN